MIYFAIILSMLLVPFVVVIALNLVAAFSSKPFDISNQSNLPDDKKIEAVESLKETRKKK